MSSVAHFFCFAVVFRVYVVFCSLCLVVSISAIDCLERLVSEMTLVYVEWDVKPYTLSCIKNGVQSFSVTASLM